MNNFHINKVLLIFSILIIYAFFFIKKNIFSIDFTTFDTFLLGSAFFILIFIVLLSFATFITISSYATPPFSTNKPIIVEFSPHPELDAWSIYLLYGHNNTSYHESLMILLCQLAQKNIISFIRNNNNISVHKHVDFKENKLLPHEKVFFDKLNLPIRDISKLQATTATYIPNTNTFDIDRVFDNAIFGWPLNFKNQVLYWRDIAPTSPYSLVLTMLVLLLVLLPFGIMASVNPYFIAFGLILPILIPLSFCKPIYTIPFINQKYLSYWGIGLSKALKHAPDLAAINTHTSGYKKYISATSPSIFTPPMIANHPQDYYHEHIPFAVALHENKNLHPDFLLLKQLLKKATKPQHPIHKSLPIHHRITYYSKIIILFLIILFFGAITVIPIFYPELLPQLHLTRQ